MDDALHDSLVTWLEEDDRRTRSYRANRLRFLRDEYGEDTDYRLFYGGLVSALAFEEARLAYLHGLFLSCIVVAQVCVEHMLQGLFYGVGRNDLRDASYAGLLQAARDEGLLSQTEFELFDRLRQLRNPYVHFRPPGDDESQITRAVEAGTAPEDLLAEDARLAAETLLRLCRRPPFAVPAG